MAGWYSKNNALYFIEPNIYWGAMKLYDMFLLQTMFSLFMYCDKA